MFAFSESVNKTHITKTLQLKPNEEYSGFYDLINDAFLLSDNGGTFYIVYKEKSIRRRLTEILKCPNDNNGMVLIFK